MENVDARREIEEMFEVCYKFGRCGRKNIQEKKAKNESYLFCVTCAMVLPNGANV